MRHRTRHADTAADAGSATAAQLTVTRPSSPSATVGFAGATGNAAGRAVAVSLQAPTPRLFAAATSISYATALVRPVIVYVTAPVTVWPASLAPVASCQAPASACGVTVALVRHRTRYPEIAAPLPAGADHDTTTRSTPAAADTPVTFSGTPAGVADTSELHAPSPALLVARTRNRYPCPVVRAVTAADVAPAAADTADAPAQSAADAKRYSTR